MYTATVSGCVNAASEVTWGTPERPPAGSRTKAVAHAPDGERRHTWLSLPTATATPGSAAGAAMRWAASPRNGDPGSGANDPPGGAARTVPLSIRHRSAPASGATVGSPVARWNVVPLSWD